MANDPYLTLTKDITSRPGFSAVDEYERGLLFKHGKIGARGYLSGAHTKQKKFRGMKRHPDEILCKHAAVAEDVEGYCRHLWAHDQRLMGFIGFVSENHDSKCSIRSSGSVLLSIPGASAHDVGRIVYAIEPDKFTLEKAKRGFPIGRIKFKQPDRKDQVCVEFTAYDSPSD